MIQRHVRKPEKQHGRTKKQLSLSLDSITTYSTAMEPFTQITTFVFYFVDAITFYTLGLINYETPTSIPGEDNFCDKLR